VPEEPNPPVRPSREHVDLPSTAAWRHLDARTGFEVVFLNREGDGYRLEGYTTAVEEGDAWIVRYTLTLDSNWAARCAHINARSALGERDVRLESHGAGAWFVDGKPMPELTGCLDVDLEASACTNTCPVQRLGLEVGQATDAPAVYLRAPDLTVERLEQSYRRLPNDGEHSRYDYVAPSFNFRSVLVYDEFGLVLDYPGIAARIA
jgi:hypothetical protein